MFLYPTVVIFCEGAGIAAAKALIEAGNEPSGLNLTRRPDVRMYYRVSLPAFPPAVAPVGAKPRIRPARDEVAPVDTAPHACPRPAPYLPVASALLLSLSPLSALEHGQLLH